LTEIQILQRELATQLTMTKKFVEGHKLQVGTHPPPSIAAQERANLGKEREVPFSGFHFT
jgi:hypothetical protein